MNYVAPNFDLDAFNCLHCDAYSRHEWYLAKGEDDDGLSLQPTDELSDAVLENYKTEDYYQFISFCYRCHGVSIWQKEKVVYPYSGGITNPNPDMPNNVKEIYIEAKGIANQSPRAAVALLRLAVQMLMPHVGERGKKIDDDIKNLVSKGLPDQIQKALDSLRVIGNNAVHPGEINIADDYETAVSLFDLLNIIIHHFISTQKMIDRIYEKLPESARARIADRDGKPVPQPK